MPHVIGAAPAILGQGVDHGAARAQPTSSVKGIDPALEPQVTDIESAMQSGSIERWAAANRSRRRRAASCSAKTWPRKLGVGVGDYGVGGDAAGHAVADGHDARAARRLRVVGIFSLGLYEFDSTLRIRLARRRQAAARQGRVDLIQLRVDDICAAPEVAQTDRRTLRRRAIPPQDWADMNQSLFSALWLEKMAISLTIGLIVMVAALNIVASLILLVMEKNRDIAILKTMGASAKSVTMIFMMQGLIIGIVGTTVGAARGIRARRIVLDRYKLIRVPIDVYQVSYVPFTVLPLRLRRSWSSPRSSSVSSRRSIRRARRRSSIPRRR